MKQSAEQKYGKHWKKWIAAYVIAGLILYAGFYYFVLAKKSPAPTDWKTYTSPAGTYSIKIPQGWNVSLLPGEDFVKIPVETPQIIHANQCPNAAENRINIFHFKSDSPIKDVQADINYDKNTFKNTKIKESLIASSNGKQGQEIIFYDKEHNTTYLFTYFVSSNGYFSISATDYCSSELSKQFDQILQTFRLTK